MAMTNQQPYNVPAAKKMKLEHESATPSTPQQEQQTSSTTTPVSTVPPYTTAPQWSTQIPIDPQLQQAQTTMMAYPHYATYNAHFPQTAYAHFSQYQPTQAAATPSASTTVQSAQISARVASQSAQAAAAITEENVDIATLNDAIGSAGVDLRAEEETLQRSQDHHTTAAYRIYDDRSRKQPANLQFDTRILGTTMREIGTRHKVSKIPEDSVTYVALALRTRLQGLIKTMVAVSEHRATSQFDRIPSLYEDGTSAWSVVVRRDLRKQLEILERIEREEEMRLRRERRERLDAAAQGAQGAGTPTIDGSVADNKGEDGNPEMNTPVKKPKKKKDGPGVTARNMSEDVQKRLSNAVATQAAGLGRGRYAWMNAGAATTSTPGPKPKAATPVVTTLGVSAAAPAATASTSTMGAAVAATSSSQPAAPALVGASTSTTTMAAPAPTSSWAKPYVSSAAKAALTPAPGEEDKVVVTMKDAMFVIERERGHGAGRGSARGWV